MQTRPLILVTNDDGIEAPGLTALVDCIHTALAAQEADIVVVAPSTPQSGKSSALTVEGMLRIRQHSDHPCGARCYSVNGTPVDCVKLGIDAVLMRTPDFIFSGINHGSNSGNSIIYSGTMGAVIEGCTLGVPGVGFSLLHHSVKADFSLSAPQVVQIIKTILAKGLPKGVCLNVNIPARVVPKGIRVCRAARGHWTQQYDKYIDPHGNPFYLLTGHFVNDEPEDTDTDCYILAQDYISVVPASVDQTDISAIPVITNLLADN